MHQKNKILILVEAGDEASIMKFLIEKSTPQGLDLFIFEKIKKPGKDRKSKQATEIENTINIIDVISSDKSISSIFSLKNYSVNWREFNEDIETKLFNSIATLNQRLKDILIDRGYEWLIAAKKEWEKSELGVATPEEWMAQFVAIDCKELGRNLLKLLKVITNHELREAFSLNRSEIEGLKVCHAFVKDVEQGSSSQTVEPILAKMHGANVAIGIDLDDSTQWQRLNVDVIYVYEDGLWSGVELVKRIERIYSADPDGKSNITFHFRFAATSDVGLIAARAATKTGRLPTINLSGKSPDLHHRFLENEFDIAKLIGRNNDEIRKALDSAVIPQAFISKELWNHKQDEWLNQCKEIGSQLTKKFLEHRKRLKDNIPASENVSISKQKAMEWGLGALNFGSTIIFSSSIPKPTIPLMWLAGTVTHNGKTCVWKPLFYDARRTGVPLGMF